jgi:hypothetical protein
LAGQAIGGLAGQAQPRPAPHPAAPVQRRPAPTATPGMVQGIAAMPGVPSGGAASQLMQLLGDPRVLQALASLALGQAGSHSVQVGGTRANPSAITNLLGVLANQATAEAMAYENVYGGTPDYMSESWGDPAVAENRAAALLDLLQETYPLPSEWNDYEYEAEPETESPPYDLMAAYEQYYDAYFDMGMDGGEDYDYESNESDSGFDEY